MNERVNAFIRTELGSPFVMVWMMNAPHVFTPGKLNTCSLFGWHSLGVVTASRRYSLAAGSGLWRVLDLSHVQFTFSAVVWLSAWAASFLLQLPAAEPSLLFHASSSEPQAIKNYFFHKWLRVMVFHHRHSKVAHTIFFWKTGLLAFTLWLEVIS